MTNSPTAADLVALIQTCGVELAEGEGLPTASLESDTVLFGPGGVLDSLGLVSLVLDLEQAIETRYDVAVTLADQRAMSQERSPFRSVQALADYAMERVQDES